MKFSLTSSAIHYTVSHLMHIAAPGLSYELREDGDEAVLLCGFVTVRLSRLPEEAYPRLLSGELPTVKLPSFDGQAEVPVYLPEGKPFADAGTDTLRVYADLLTVPFLLLSRKEEQLLTERDPYGRFLYQYSLAKKYGFIDLPIIDEWAMLLRQELLRYFSEEALGRNCPTLRPTHDVDEMRRFPGAKKTLRSILGGDLLMRRSPLLAWASLREYLRCRKQPSLDPSVLGAEKLLDASLRYGLRSEFYFMGLESGEEDFRYDAVRLPSVAAFAARARESGMVCGFHGSRLTPMDSARFRLEQQRVAEMLGASPTCGRQHYLCFDPLETPRVWAENGMREDSTLGYADREGYRCGTSFSFPLYDLVNDRPLPVVEHPLAAMEVALHGRGLSDEEMLASLKRLFKRSIAVGGDFVILWHNDNTMRDWAQRFQRVYLPFLDWAVKKLHEEKKA